jgi:hypothetical protein
MNARMQATTITPMSVAATSNRLPTENRTKHLTRPPLLAHRRIDAPVRGLPVHNVGTEDIFSAAHDSRPFV